MACRSSPEWTIMVLPVGVGRTPGGTDCGRTGFVALQAWPRNRGMQKRIEKSRSCTCGLSVLQKGYGSKAFMLNACNRKDWKTYLFIELFQRGMKKPREVRLQAKATKTAAKMEFFLLLP
jgi:hypothetical protein